MVFVGRQLYNLRDSIGMHWGFINDIAKLILYVLRTCAEQGCQQSATSAAGEWRHFPSALSRLWQCLCCKQLLDAYWSLIMFVIACASSNQALRLMVIEPLTDRCKPVSLTAFGRMNT